jgi:hypothetical protein
MSLQNVGTVSLLQGEKTLIVTLTSKSGGEKPPGGMKTKFKGTVQQELFI